MAQCNWDPSKHGGKPCPVHGVSGNENNVGHKIRINGGKYQVKYADSEDYEDTDKDTFEHLRESGQQDFDETVDDDFGFDEDGDYKIYEDKIREELEKVKSKEDAEYVSDLIDNNMEAGYISEEMADELYAELDKKIDALYDKGPEDSNTSADQVLDNNDDNTQKPDESSVPEESDVNNVTQVRINPVSGYEIKEAGNTEWQQIDEDRFNAEKENGAEEVEYEEQEKKDEETILREVYDILDDEGKKVLEERYPHIFKKDINS